MRVALEPHRDAARALWLSYVQALYHRSLPEVRVLFADVVGGLQGAATLVSREAVMEIYDRILQGLDTGGRSLADVMDPSAVEIRGTRDFSPESPAPPAMRPGDLWVSGRVRFGSTLGVSAPIQGVPQTFLVRWIDGTPRIVGVPDALLRIVR